MSLQHLGRERFAAMIDYTLQLALNTAEQIRQTKSLELLAAPTLNAVVFRYIPSLEMESAQADELNHRIRDRLLESGRAVIARTRAKEKACLKLTLLNPLTTPQDTADILAHVVRTGMELEQHYVIEQHALRGV
ncbi:L-2,4-diaminobutyrate decarboxylase [compost metagenome]